MVLSNKNKMPLTAHLAILGKVNTQAMNRKAPCLMKSVGCNCRAIKSHTIQQASLLKISDKTNHLYTLENPNLDNNTILLNKISAAKATIYYGFCKFHDTEIFKCIEIEPIMPTIEQLSAIYHRALGYLYYSSIGFKEVISNVLNYSYPDYHKPNSALRVMDDIRKVQERNRLEIEKSYQQMVQSETENIALNGFLFIRLNQIPDIMLSVIVPILFGINGEEIIDANHIPDEMHCVCVTFSSDVNGGYICLQWNKSEYISSRFISTFMMNDYNLNRLVMYFMASYDSAISVTWWDSLSEDKVALIYRLLKVSPLAYYDEYMRSLELNISLVSWEVTSVAKNV